MPGVTRRFIRLGSRQKIRGAAEVYLVDRLSSSI
jgi:hypothetical protein